MKKSYFFKASDYDATGFNKFTDMLFSDFVTESEKDFYKTMRPFYANLFISNSITMFLFQKCFQNEKNYCFGMDMIEGEINFNTNMKIDDLSKLTMIYSISSGIEGRDDESLWLVIDDNMPDNKFELKFIPDIDEYD